MRRFRRGKFSAIGSLILAGLIAGALGRRGPGAETAPAELHWLRSHGGLHGKGLLQASQPRHWELRPLKLAAAFNEGHWAWRGSRWVWLAPSPDQASR